MKSISYSTWKDDELVSEVPFNWADIVRYKLLQLVIVSVS